VNGIAATVHHLSRPLWQHLRAWSCEQPKKELRKG
jgi:hypothetical protein